MTNLGRRVVASLVVFLLASAMAGVAFAFWTSTDSSNPAAAAADTLAAGNTPSLSGIAGLDVTLAWTASTTTAGVGVSGYTLARYSVASGGTPTAATGGCAGTVAVLTCTEQSVPVGTWYYAVTPRISLWAGAESARRMVTVTGDVTPPSGGSVSYTNGYVTTASVSVTMANGTDASGINTATTQLQRASATLTTGSCGTFGSFTSVGSTGAASPYADTSVLSGNCYQYQYVVADNAGNAATYTSASVVKVDTSAATFPVTSTGTGVSTNGTAVYFKNGGAGTFTVTATDTQSGVASSSFPAAPTGWSVSGSGNARTYTLGSANGSSSILVSATNGAGTASGNQTITITLDATQPVFANTNLAIAPIDNATTGGFIRQGGQYYVYANPTDAGSGLATVTANVNNITTGQTAVPLVAGNYTLGATTYAYRSAAITANAGLTAGNKNYTGTAIDALGNTRTTTNATVVADNTNPTGSITAPAGWATASTTVTANSADASSGVASTQFQYSPAGAGTWATIATDTTSPYSVTWDTTALTNGGSYDLRAITTDNASNTFTSTTVTVTVDRTAPAAPSAPAFVLASDTGLLGDGITRLTLPTLTGTAEAGTTVKIYDGGTQIGSGTATLGVWVILTSTLGTGPHTITATATDAAGNVSVASTAMTLTVDPTAPATASVTLADGPGVAGTSDAGDTATVTFSEQLDASTLCSTWTNTGVQSLSNATVTVTNAGGSDILTVTTPTCTFNYGNLVFGDYVSATATFTSSTIAWDPTAKTLTVTLGTFSTGTLRTGAGTTRPKYTAVAAMTDLAGNPMPTTTFTDPANSGF